MVFMHMDSEMNRDAHTYKMALDTNKDTTRTKTEIEDLLAHNSGCQRMRFWIKDQEEDLEIKQRGDDRPWPRVPSQAIHAQSVAGRGRLIEKAFKKSRLDRSECPCVEK
jgi:hypothetical protein